MQVTEERINQLNMLGVEIESNKVVESDKEEILISRMQIPYLYEIPGLGITKSSVALEENLNEDEKRRFFYFIKSQVEYYEQIKKYLEKMLESKSSLLFLIPLCMIGLVIISISAGNHILLGISAVLVYYTWKFFPSQSSVDVQNKNICEDCLQQVQKLIEQYNNIDIATEKEIIEQISKQVDEITYKLAKEACGIEESDIKHHSTLDNNTEDKKSVVLSEFAFLQDEKLSGYKSLDKSYIDCYKIISSPDKQYYISPCLYIKYIFILEEKVETYSTFYDAIKNTKYGRDIQSFYYEDISKVSESDDEVRNYEVTRFEVAINSGDKILMNLKNDQTKEEFKKNENKNYEKKLKNAENDLKIAKDKQDKMEIDFAQDVLDKIKNNNPVKGKAQKDDNQTSEARRFANALKKKIKDLKKSVSEKIVTPEKVVTKDNPQSDKTNG